MQNDGTLQLGDFFELHWVWTKKGFKFVVSVYGNTTLESGIREQLQDGDEIVQTRRMDSWEVKLYLEPKTSNC